MKSLFSFGIKIVEDHTRLWEKFDDFVAYALVAHLRHITYKLLTPALAYQSSECGPRKTNQCVFALLKL